jgi:arylsulfatase A-like enzyme
MYRSLTDVFQRLRHKTLVSTSIAAAGMGLFTSPTRATADEPLRSSESASPSAHGATAARRATRGRPNILYIVADDLGYSDLGAFGGEIRTPNIDQLVQDGRTLTNFHTSSVSAVTRSMLYSGTDHHLVGEGTMGAPRDERKGLPGYEGYLNDRALSVAQLLQDGGYHTYIAGKWHLGSDISRGQTPDAWGFEHSYTLLGGAAADHFGHELADSKNYASDGKYVRPGQPGQPGGDGTEFYDTNFYTQKLIEFIDSRTDGQPFAAFATYTSPHWPLQVSEPYLSAYRGVYDVGYDVIRGRRLFRQKLLGLIPGNHTENPGLPEALAPSPATPNWGTPAARYLSATHNDPSYVDHGPGRVNKKWDSLSPSERRLYARYMEIYAGMVENLDHNVGLLIQHLKDIGEYDNTVIVFHSDNGAEGGPLSAAQDAFNSLPENFARLGQSGSNVHIGLRWAEVGATPLKLFKSYVAEGGVSVPAVVRLPWQEGGGAFITEFAHVTDSAPTLLELAGIEPPTEPAPPLLDANGVDRNQGKVVYKGRYVYPITGVSLVDALEGRGRGPIHKDPVGEEQYGRAYLRDGPWKALWIEPPLGPVDGHWQLYHVETDRSEVHDVSAENPDVVERLVGEWDAYMKRVGGVEPLRPGN